MVQKKKTTVKKGNNGNGKKLTKKDIEHFHQLLLLKRKEILGDVTEISEGALSKSRETNGDLSSMPIHMADMGSDNFEQEFALGLVDSERKMVKLIDQALERIENGSYGVCLGIKKPIKKARLEAKPWAKYSVQYAEMIEKGLVPKEEQ